MTGEKLKRVKPKEIHVGRAYRMALPFLAGPSDQIAVVVSIRPATARSKLVKVEWLHPGPVFSTFSLAEFPRHVWREEPMALQ